MTRNEQLEKISEKVVAEKLNDAFNKVTEKYEEIVKEHTESEMERVNQATLESCPEYGALVINLDGCELSFTYSDNTDIKIDNGDKEYTIKGNQIGKEIPLFDIIALMTANEEQCKFVKVHSCTEKEIELYNKEKLEKENKKLKYKKIYVKDFEGVYPKSKITAVYKINGTLK